MQNHGGKNSTTCFYSIFLTLALTISVTKILGREGNPGFNQGQARKKY
jgi:hypothetical protein